MVYIITEDSKSGFSFWNEINSTFNLCGRVHKSDGNDRLPDLLLTLFDGDKPEYQLLETDRIIVSYDMFASRMLKQLKAYLSTLVEEHKCAVFISTYGSIEAAILTFLAFSDWVDIERVETKYLKAFNIFKQYYHYDGFIPYFFSRYKGNCHEDMYDFNSRGKNDNSDWTKFKTMEKSVTELLRELTRNNSFFIDKGELSECWTQTCCSLSEKKCPTKLLRPGIGKMHKLGTWLSYSEFSDGFAKIEASGNVIEGISIWDSLGFSRLEIPHENLDNLLPIWKKKKVSIPGYLTHQFLKTRAMAPGTDAIANQQKRQSAPASGSDATNAFGNE